MKIYFQLFFYLIFSSSISAQAKYPLKVVYNLSYQFDSISKNTSREKFVLFLSEHKSYFISKKILQSDSLLQTSFKDPNVRLLSSARALTYFNERIFKNEDQLNVYFKNNKAHYLYKENQKIKWVISNEQKMINGINCYKATGSAFGRNWIAYFSREYPFSTGPYKFSGLPGLIIEIFDTNMFYKFIVDSIEKGDYLIQDDFANPYLIEKKKYFEMINELKYGSTIFGGIQFEDSSEMESIKKARRERRKFENNFPIDKDMRYLFE